MSATIPGLGVLTARQREVLDAYVALLCREGLPPSLRSMGEALGIRVHAIHCHFQRLAAKGYLAARLPDGRQVVYELTPAAARQYRLVRADGPCAVRLRRLAVEEVLSAAEARELAAELLRAADAAEGDSR